jgi:hypothetical protein
MHTLSLALALGVVVYALPSDEQQIFGLQNPSSCEFFCPRTLREPGSKLVNNGTSTTSALACVYLPAEETLGWCQYSKVRRSFLHCA